MNADAPGAQAPESDYLKRWNWGAFLLNIFWGMGNRVYVALLMMVPGVNFAVMFFLGARGTEWAWEKGEWRDVEHFKSTQRKWTRAAVIIWLLALPGFFLMFTGLFKGDAYELSLEAIRANPDVVELIGSPMDPSYLVTGKMEVNAGGGQASLRYTLTGPEGQADARVEAKKLKGEWVLMDVRVVGDDGTKIEVVSSRTKPAEADDPDVRQMNAD